MGKERTNGKIREAREVRQQSGHRWQEPPKTEPRELGDCTGVSSSGVTDRTAQKAGRRGQKVKRPGPRRREVMQEVGWGETAS